MTALIYVAGAALFIVGGFALGRWYERERRTDLASVHDFERARRALRSPRCLP